MTVYRVRSALVVWLLALLIIVFGGWVLPTERSVAGSVPPKGAKP